MWKQWSIENREEASEEESRRVNLKWRKYQLSWKLLKRQPMTIESSEVICRKIISSNAIVVISSNISTEETLCVVVMTENAMCWSSMHLGSVLCEMCEKTNENIKREMK